MRNGAQIDAKLGDESESTPLDLALKTGEKRHLYEEKRDLTHFQHSEHKWRKTNFVISFSIRTGNKRVAEVIRRFAANKH